VIGGAYNDHNHNHKQDRGDEWLSGWAIQLSSADGQMAASQATHRDGRAPFTNLRPGTYTLCESPASGWYNITPGGAPPCYTVAVAPGKAVWARFGNSTAPLAARADAAQIGDIITCDLAPTDDAGSPTAPERDPWEEEEDAAALRAVFLPVVWR
jgi:hypothetical protein